MYKIILFQGSEQVLFGPKALLMWFTEISRTVVNNKIHCRTSVLSQQTFLVFQDVFSVTLFAFQDLSKTSWRRLPKTSSRRLAIPLQDVLKTSSGRVCKTPCNYVLKTTWRRLEDVFSTPSPRRMFAGVISR